MAIKNNVMIVRQKLLTKLVSLWNEGKLIDNIDRVEVVTYTLVRHVSCEYSSVRWLESYEEQIR